MKGLSRLSFMTNNAAGEDGEKAASYPLPSDDRLLNFSPHVRDDEALLGERAGTPTFQRPRLPARPRALTDGSVDDDAGEFHIVLERGRRSARASGARVSLSLSPAPLRRPCGGDGVYPLHRVSLGGRSPPFDRRPPAGRCPTRRGRGGEGRGKERTSPTPRKKGSGRRLHLQRDQHARHRLTRLKHTFPLFTSSAPPLLFPRVKGRESFRQAQGREGGEALSPLCFLPFPDPPEVVDPAARARARADAVFSAAYFRRPAMR